MKATPGTLAVKSNVPIPPTFAVADTLEEPLEIWLAKFTAISLID